MKLRSVYIDGFGKLRDKKIELHEGLTIVHGTNEAGKSTMFGFVRAMLYGFAARSQMPVRQEPVFGGKHGGRLELQSDKLGALVLERYAGVHGGRAVVRLAAAAVRDSQKGLVQEDVSRVMEQAELERQLFGGINSKAYQQLFAISLDELREVSALHGDELGKHLYHAGLYGGKQLIATEKRLQERMDSLFRPRGTTQAVNKQLQQLEKLEAQLRSIPDELELYNQTIDKLRAIDQELEQLDSSLPDYISRSELYRKAIDARQQWIELETLRAQLGRLELRGTLPADVDTKWQLWLQESRRLEEERSRLAALCAAAERRTAETALEETMLDLLPQAERLLLSAESIQSLETESAAVEAESRAHEDVVRSLLHRISPQWGLEELRAFHAGIAERERVRLYRRTLQECERLLERAVEGVRSAKEKVSETELALRQLQSSEGTHKQADTTIGKLAFIPQSKDELLRSWNQFEEALRAWEASLLQLLKSTGTEEAKASSATPIFGSYAVLSAAAAGLGVSAGLVLKLEPWQTAALATAAAAVPLVRFAVIKLLQNSGSGRRRSGTPANRSADLDMIKRERNVVEALDALVVKAHEQAAGLQGDRDRTWLDKMASAGELRGRLYQALQNRLDELRKDEAEGNRQLELTKQLERNRAMLAEREHDYESAQLRFEGERADWERWLQEAGFPGVLSPESALEMMELAGQAADRLLLIERATGKFEDARKRIQRYKDEAVELCARYEPANRLIQQDPTAAVRLLMSELVREQELVTEHTTAKKRELELREEMEMIARREQEQAAVLDEWLLAAEAKNLYEWEKGLEAHRSSEKLRSQITRLEVELFSGMTDAKRRQLLEVLEQHDEAELTRWSEHYAEQESAARKRHRELLTVKGRLQQTADSTLRESERRVFMQQREDAAAQVLQDMDSYVEHAVMLALMKATKERLERERQPAVLRNASHYASVLTRGAYVRVIAPPGEQVIRLESAGGALVEASFLSRGASEQIYLALRLALADEADAAEPMPMLLDDLFVNYDPERLNAAASLMTELAGRRQLLLLTCHTHVREALQNACREAHVVEV